jgi:hypothetical protein
MVRIVFIAGEGTGREPAFTVESLERAEMEFVQTFGLSPELAAGLRRQLERNNVFAVEASLDETVAAMYCRVLLTSDGSI